jgi:transcriptional regulator with XRE-family HTH domain
MLPKKQTFGERLKIARQHLKLSMQEFAARAGCDRTYIYRLENAQRQMPSAEFIEVLARRFGINEDWLVSGKGPIFQTTAPFQHFVAEGLAAASIPVTTEDHDRGFIKANLKYRRGSPPQGFPKSVLLTRISAREIAGLTSMVITNRDPNPVLIASLPPEHRADTFLDKLTPFCVVGLVVAAFTLNYGEEEGSAILKRIGFSGS